MYRDHLEHVIRHDVSERLERRGSLRSMVGGRRGRHGRRGRRGWHGHSSLLTVLAHRLLPSSAVLGTHRLLPSSEQLGVLALGLRRERREL